LWGLKGDGFGDGGGGQKLVGIGAVDIGVRFASCIDGHHPK
jgi:hypothetical protein